SPLRSSSRLSKTLLEVVRDQNALACFKAFMKSQRAEHFIQFWCDAESFHATALTRLHTHSFQCLSRKRRTESANSAVSETLGPKDDSANCEASAVVGGLTSETKEAFTENRLNEPSPASPNGEIVQCSAQCHSDVSSLAKADPPGLNQCRSASGDQWNLRNSNIPSVNDTVRAVRSGNLSQNSTTNVPSDPCVERDAVTIFSTYIAKDAPRPIGVDDDLRSEAISKICQENGKVDPECFVNCQRYVLEKMESEYFLVFRDSAFYCRHQVHMLTTEKVFLPDILLNENALCYFMEYMEQDGGSDLMQVWLCASNFQQQLQATRGSYDPVQAQTDAMVIYDKYFSLQATNPVGFDDKLRFEIESNICREEGPLPDCFTKAKNIVLKMLEM
ncbi:hypothetical protein EGW08_018316, partial [Elysia chlorotica]